MSAGATGDRPVCRRGAAAGRLAGALPPEPPLPDVPRAAAAWTLRDRLGAYKVRWGIGRDDYAVDPGLYHVGAPGPDSEVLVTASYKLTFDVVRRALAGLDAWLLVLDTKGVNVWCAAGKGTFGTSELVRRVKAVSLDRRVAHRRLVLPQLGAVGVAAHEVKRATGFAVDYGPVRIGDLPAYLAAGRVATPAMRRVRFSLRDRIALVPGELVFAIKPLLVAFGVLFLLDVLGLGRFGPVDAYATVGAVLVGTVLVPILLPWIPGRAFAFKGALLGVLWALGVAALNGWPAAPTLAWPRALAYLLVLPALSAFAAMNFTGSTTFTSPSGVNREMRTAVPAMAVAAAAGALVLVAEMALGWFAGGAG